LNLRRLGRLAPGAWLRAFWLLVAGTTLLTVALDFLGVPIQGIVFVLIVTIAASEAWLSRRAPGASHGMFLLALALIAAGGVFSALDVTRTWCDPWHPYLQGHAFWHVLSALCLFAAYFHSRQFEPQLGDGAQLTNSRLSD
jgi:hypothetical protein